MQGYEPNDLINMPPSLSDNLSILMLFGFLGDVLAKYFNSLAKISDWENLYTVLTANFQKDVTWPTGNLMAEPKNTNDLLWKTKLRFQSLHRVRHAEVESQKRVSSYSCAMMGVRPVNKLSKCILWDETVRLPTEKSICSRQGMEEKAKAEVSNLIRHQADMVTVHIVIDKVKTNYKRIPLSEAKFYQAFSKKKAIAATLAQKRSWKDCFLLMCRSKRLLSKLHPADFSHAFFDARTEDPEWQGEIAESGGGICIESWAEDCKRSIYEVMFEERGTPAFQNVMKGSFGPGVPDFSNFYNRILEKNGTNSKFKSQTKIPKPQPVVTLACLFFLTAPANATTDEQGTVLNDGLDDLLAVTASNGRGDFVPPCQNIGCCSFEEKDINCKQTAS
jgi:hypothetical protein